MLRPSACVLIGVLTLGGTLAALAQTKAPAPNPKEGPKDRQVGGEFTPDRVRTDIEGYAKKLQDSGKGPPARYRNAYFVWNSMTPVEFDAVGRNIVHLLVILTHKGEELPVKRVFLRVDGKDTPLTKVSSWRTPVDAGSATAKMYGSNREDGFYLVPGGAMLRKGTVLIDMSANRTDWILGEYPANVATANAKHFPKLDPPGKPNLAALQDFVRRKFAGFPVPTALP